MSYAVIFVTVLSFNPFQPDKILQAKIVGIKGHLIVLLIFSFLLTDWGTIVDIHSIEALIPV